MKIKTTQFGEIEYTQDRVISFEAGLFGFEEYKKFLLIKREEDLFFWLTSIDEPEIVFPLFGVNILDDNYPAAEGNEPFAVVTLNSNPAEITVNLKAPVYIDQELKVGQQKILDNDKYAVDYNLFIE